MRKMIDIADTVIRDAEELARREGRTLGSLTEERLRLVLQRARKGNGREIKPVVFDGDGPSSDAPPDFWEKVRDFAAFPSLATRNPLSR